MYLHNIFLVAVAAKLVAASNTQTMLDILKEDDFSEAVLQLANLWKAIHGTKTRELELVNIDKLRAVLSFSQTNKSSQYPEYKTSEIKGSNKEYIVSRSDIVDYRNNGVQRDGALEGTQHNAIPQRGRRVPRHSEQSLTELAERINSTILEQEVDTTTPDTSHDREQLGEYTEDPPLDTHLPFAIENFGTMHEKAKRRRLLDIKTQILNKLQLYSPPNISKETFRRNPVVDKLERQVRLDNEPGWQGDDPGLGDGFHEDDDFYAKPMRVIHLAERLPSTVSRLINATANLCYFTFREVVLRSKVDRAKLWVYIRHIGRPRNVRRKTRIVINKVVLIPNEETGLSQHVMNVSRVLVKKMDLRHGGRWHLFDITKEVSDLVKRSSFGLFKVEAFGNDGMPLAVVQPMNDAENDLVPFFDIRLKERNSRSRRKRHFSRDCDTTSREERCCRYPFMVDFEEFGWDFIRQPRRFNAYYCSGACEVDHNLYENAHGRLVDQVLENPYASGSACCVPTKLSPRNVIYQDTHGNYIYGIIPGMTVDRCTCA